MSEQSQQEREMRRLSCVRGRVEENEIDFVTMKDREVPTRPKLGSTPRSSIVRKRRARRHKATIHPSGSFRIATQAMYQFHFKALFDFPSSLCCTLNYL